MTRRGSAGEQHTFLSPNAWSPHSPVTTATTVWPKICRIVNRLVMNRLTWRGKESKSIEQSLGFCLKIVNSWTSRCAATKTESAAKKKGSAWMKINHQSQKFREAEQSPSSANSKRKLRSERAEAPILVNPAIPKKPSALTFLILT